jgi:hypothetical protein
MNNNPLEAVPDDSYFCPYCGLVLDEKDCEDQGYFHTLLRCPRCNNAHVINSQPVNYDYGRNSTDPIEKYKSVKVLLERTAKGHVKELERWDEIR